MKTDPTQAPAVKPPKQDIPAVVQNPFAKNLADHISAGSVAIEGERATAEVQAKIIVAKRFPRDIVSAAEKTLEQCRRYEFAESALFKYERGKETITGPSIRLAEEFARNYTNIEYGLRELSQKDGESEMEAYAWDVENNVTSIQRFTVKHRRETKSGTYDLTSERDIYEATANMGARRMRARILAIMPPELIDAAVKQCELTVKKGPNGKSIDDRRKDMVSAFQKLGVSEKMLIDYTGKKKLIDVDADDIVSLTAVYQSIKSGSYTKDVYFGAPSIEKPSGEPTAKPEGKQPEKQPAKKKEATGTPKTTETPPAKTPPVKPDPVTPDFEPELPAQNEPPADNGGDEFADL